MAAAADDTVLRVEHLTMRFGGLVAVRDLSFSVGRGDITALWFHDLDLRWKRGPAAIAGMTDANALFCLDLLARDKGMHVASREERPGGLVAWVIAPRTNAKL